MAIIVNSSIIAEIQRLVVFYDSLPKEVQQEIIQYIQGQHGSGRYSTLKKAQKKEYKPPVNIGSINLYIE